MVAVSSLWLPVLLSAVLIFVVSSIIHMVTPWHKGDYNRLAEEDGVMAVLRPFALKPGDYMVPRPSSMAEMGSPAFADKVKQGPRLMMTVFPGSSMSMTSNLVGWFVYLLVVAAMVAFLDTIVQPPGAHHHDVFHVTLIASFLGYAAALWQMVIWYNRSISTTLRSTIDGVLYALITAGVFSYFWPA
jgi:hypothetical protein